MSIQITNAPGSSSSVKTAPTMQTFLSTGTITGYLFSVSSANATVGATYTNNGNTYIVLATISSGTQLFCSGANAPTSSGTLTKSSGTGDATITFSKATPMATYTAPTNPAPFYLKVYVVGGGGGGGGGGSEGGSSTPGSSGSISTFGSNLLIAYGGSGGGDGNSGIGGNGGAASINAGAAGLALTGTMGMSVGASTPITSTVNLPGGAGGSTPYVGNGTGVGLGAGSNANPNTGSGGGGGAWTGSSEGYSGGGGGSGGYISAYITSSLSSNYYYIVASGGNAGTSSDSGGSNGGNGASGIVIVEEFYQ